METTRTINISDSLFTINDDAFLLLKKYLDKLSEDSLVDLNDVEARIAQMFMEMGASTVRVVSISNVREVINRLSIVVNDDSSWGNSKTSTNLKRKLLRDPNDRMISGVCAALAVYWGTDLTIVRIVFILITIFGGTGVMLYIALLIVMPKAVSKEDFEIIERMKNGTL